MSDTQQETCRTIVEIIDFWGAYCKFFPNQSQTNGVGHNGTHVNGHTDEPSHTYLEFKKLHLPDITAEIQSVFTTFNVIPDIFLLPFVSETKQTVYPENVERILQLFGFKYVQNANNIFDVFLENHPHYERVTVRLNELGYPVSYIGHAPKLGLENEKLKLKKCTYHEEYLYNTRGQIMAQLTFTTIGKRKDPINPKLTIILNSGELTAAEENQCDAFASKFSANHALHYVFGIDCFYEGESISSIGDHLSSHIADLEMVSKLLAALSEGFLELIDQETFSWICKLIEDETAIGNNAAYYNGDKMAMNHDKSTVLLTSLQGQTALMSALKKAVEEEGIASSVVKMLLPDIRHSVEISTIPQGIKEEFLNKIDEYTNQSKLAVGAVNA